MFRKLLFLVTVGLLLSAGLVTVNPSHASGLPGYYSSYWYKPRVVHVKRSVMVYQVNPAMSKTIQKLVLVTDSKVTIWDSTDFGWVAKAPYLSQNRGYIWVVKGHDNPNWLKW